MDRVVRSLSPETLSFSERANKLCHDHNWFPQTVPVFHDSSYHQSVRSAFTRHWHNKIVIGYETILEVRGRLLLKNRRNPVVTSGDIANGNSIDLRRVVRPIGCSMRLQKNQNYVADQKHIGLILETRKKLARQSLQETDAFGAESGNGCGSSLPESVITSICNPVKKLSLDGWQTETVHSHPRNSPM